MENEIMKKPGEEITPKTGKVVTGKVKAKSKSRAQKIAEVFAPEDLRNVKDYVLFDILLPAIRDTIVDVIQKSTTMFFYGKPSGGSRRNASSGGTITSYNSMFGSGGARPSGGITPKSRMMYEVMDLSFESRDEAQTVLDVMCDIIEQYGKVTVADYYNACDVTGNGYTDNYYGWTDLRQAWINGDRSGYFINMPRPLDLRQRR